MPARLGSSAIAQCEAVSMSDNGNGMYSLKPHHLQLMVTLRLRRLRVPGHSRDGTALLSQGMVRPRNCLDSGSGVLKDIIFLGSTFVNPSNERTKYHFDARLLNWGRGGYVSMRGSRPMGAWVSGYQGGDPPIVSRWGGQTWSSSAIHRETYRVW